MTAPSRETRSRSFSESSSIHHDGKKEESKTTELSLRKIAETSTQSRSSLVLHASPLTSRKYMTSSIDVESSDDSSSKSSENELSQTAYSEITRRGTIDRPKDVEIDNTINPETLKNLAEKVDNVVHAFNQIHTIHKSVIDNGGRLGMKNNMANQLLQGTEEVYRTLNEVLQTLYLPDFAYELHRAPTQFEFFSISHPISKTYKDLNKLLRKWFVVDFAKPFHSESAKIFNRLFPEYPSLYTAYNKAMIEHDKSVMRKIEIKTLFNYLYALKQVSLSIKESFFIDKQIEEFVQKFKEEIRQKYKNAKQDNLLTYIADSLTSNLVENHLSPLLIHKIKAHLKEEAQIKSSDGKEKLISIDMLAQKIDADMVGLKDTSGLESDWIKATKTSRISFIDQWKKDIAVFPSGDDSKEFGLSFNSLLCGIGKEIYNDSLVFLAFKQFIEEQFKYTESDNPDNLKRMVACCSKLIYILNKPTKRDVFFQLATKAVLVNSPLLRFTSDFSIKDLADFYIMICLSASKNFTDLPITMLQWGYDVTFNLDIEGLEDKPFYDLQIDDNLKNSIQFCCGKHVVSSTFIRRYGFCAGTGCYLTSFLTHRRRMPGAEEIKTPTTLEMYWTYQPEKLSHIKARELEKQRTKLDFISQAYNFTFKRSKDKTELVQIPKTTS